MALALDRALHDENQNGTKPSRFPKLPLYSMFALLITAVALIVFGQTTGIGVLKDNNGSPIAIRDIVFVIDEAGVIQVNDLQTGKQIKSYGINEGGFVRGSQRALERMRFVAKAPVTEPYRLIRWENGALTLSDTVTGHKLHLNAYGPTNSGAFAQLLDLKVPTKNTTAKAAKTN